MPKPITITLEIRSINLDHEATVETLVIQGRPHVIVSSLLKALGLNPSFHLKRLQAEKAYNYIVVPRENPQKIWAELALDYVHACEWLAMVSEDKRLRFSPATRKKLKEAAQRIPEVIYTAWPVADLLGDDDEDLMGTSTAPKIPDVDKEEDRGQQAAASPGDGTLDDDGSVPGGGKALVAHTLDFHGQELLIVEVDGKPFVPMKPIVEGMGLDWGSQHRKMIANSRYSHMTIPLKTNSGTQRMLSIPLKKLNGWLFSVNAEKVHPSIYGIVVRYQEECFIALHDYWHHGAAYNPRFDHGHAPRRPVRPEHHRPAAQPRQAGQPWLFNGRPMVEYRRIDANNFVKTCFSHLVPGRTQFVDLPVLNPVIALNIPREDRVSIREFKKIFSDHYYKLGAYFPRPEAIAQAAMFTQADTGVCILYLIGILQAIDTSLMALGDDPRIKNPAKYFSPWYNRGPIRKRFDEPDGFR